MATPEIAHYVFNTLTNQFGNMWVVGLIILGFFAIGFMFTGISFRWGLILCLPLVLALGGFLLPVWASGLLYIGLIAFVAYLAYNALYER